MTEQEFNAVVIDRLARIETGVVALNEKVDKLSTQSEAHNNTLSTHEARLLVLESKQGAWRIVLTVATGLVAVAAFALTVLDRLYQ
jgi:endonuclease V-like protein UPF0215 family